MTLGSKGHSFDNRMKKYDFKPRKTLDIGPYRIKNMPFCSSIISHKIKLEIKINKRIITSRSQISNGKQE